MIGCDRPWYGTRAMYAATENYRIAPYALMYPGAIRTGAVSESHRDIPNEQPPVAKEPTPEVADPQLVGEAGFEPAVSPSQTARIAKLSHTPMCRLLPPSVPGEHRPDGRPSPVSEFTLPRHSWTLSAPIGQRGSYDGSLRLEVTDNPTRGAGGNRNPVLRNIFRILLRP